MEVSMSKTRRGKYTDNRICYISKCKEDMRLYLRRKGKLPCFSYLVRGKSFSFYRGKIGIPMEIIGRALGHSIWDNSITGVYVEYDTSKIDEANRKVIDYLNADLGCNKDNK